MKNLEIRTKNTQHFANFAFWEKIEKLQIEGKFNKIKIILKKVKTQQNFEKNQNFKKSTNLM